MADQQKLLALGHLVTPAVSKKNILLISCHSGSGKVSAQTCYSHVIITKGINKSISHHRIYKFHVTHLQR